ncbi:MAG TPA: amidohydrolase [Woeseiaceae bacterium]|nr:amidohydrolase [Woeseiaceae bacterium]
MSTLTITIVQADLHWHDAAANRDDFARVVRGLECPGDLVVLPEMFTTGFTMDAPGQAETMHGATLPWLETLARDVGAAVCGSLIIEDGGRYFNRFVLMTADGQLSVYDKRHLFRLAGEDRHYAAGTSLVTVTLNGWRIRPMVCYDLRFPVWSRRRGNDEFELLLYVANWPRPRHHAWSTLLRARAIENQCYVAGVNRSGTDGNGHPYAGGSAIIDFLGHDVAALGDEVGTATATLDRAALVEFRRKYPFDRDADRFAITPASSTDDS